MVKKTSKSKPYDTHSGNIPVRRGNRVFSRQVSEPLLYHNSKSIDRAILLKQSNLTFEK